LKRQTAFLIVLLCLVPLQSAAQTQTASPIIGALSEELTRIFGLLQKQPDQAYFIAFQVNEIKSVNIEGTLGALRISEESHARYLDIDVRIGDYAFDNTHQIRGSGRDLASAPAYVEPVLMPIEDDPDAWKSVIWLEADRRYRAAVERWMQVKANRAIKVVEEDLSPDHTREQAQTAIALLPRIEIKNAYWENKVRQYSALFRKHPEIQDGTAEFSITVLNKFLVNSEGTAIQSGTTRFRLGLRARAKAEDGMDLDRAEFFDSHTEAGLPADAVVQRAIERMIQDLKALRSAPMIEPYTGPAILSGRAAGVFFHEIFGHRIEGQRQRGEDEGQTFSKQINKPVLPDFISVLDDPTLRQSGSIDLNGNYEFDDEGVKARPVPVVENGILKNFLLSRLPIAGFDQSNGHGRKAPGYRAAGRQGTLVVRSSKSVPNARLREMLIEEVKRQGKQYGLFFDDITGGFTVTGRSSPQAFQVTPIMVYRVYADGRPDTLVRGVDLIGTPLTSFSKIIAAGDKLEVFNGFCGAESGSIPVSAVAPALLTAQIEVQKKQKSAERLPILPPPSMIPEEARP
jgi:TldD protein